ncbi:sigma-70 family RNA polymerase sigma factor [Sphingobacterium sp. SRCM116780]|uniref:RNA polymerase sigma factor n=1 Tax=Sphingobacterium sp. SRCM116780 TaxID=2907623 RepID=UPI001F245E49|nr:sigma-70 family RNA polymerase sigma factor [Sphingobacterium sp. SRCM116780]UIR56924.1 sigma-70 family RNA polymerase sigma factor [Sphingobacterium sp. SRCM116780]
MDQHYIDKVLSGDRNSFRYFLQKYQDMVFSVAMSIVKNETIAEEVAQDAFVKCYHKLESFNQQSKFSSWLYRIVVNTAFMQLRKIKIEVLDFQSDYEDDVIDESTLTALEETERSQMINEALCLLPANESLALRLFYLEEESIKEVSLITGWTDANTRVILHRARKRMYGILKKLMKKSIV